MDEVITTRLEKHYIHLLDQFVSQGRFKSRSEAIRTLLLVGIDSIITKNLQEGQSLTTNQPSVLSTEELLEIGEILFKRPIVEMVAEGRKR